MLPWSFVFDQELYELSRFSQHLRADDRAVFEDLITQCKHYAPVGEVLPSPERKMSLLFWMIFAQHKRIMELEKCLNGTSTMNSEMQVDASPTAEGQAQGKCRVRRLGHSP